jgi:integrase
MTGRALAALEEAQRAATCDYVIEWGGKPVRSIRKSFREACARARLQDVTPHDLRRSAAVWMAEAGVPMTEIAAYLGHTDPKITFRHYARYSPSYLKGAAKALE